MSDRFSGSVLRFAQVEKGTTGVIWESWFLSLLPERQVAEQMFGQIYSRAGKWWLVDAVDFDDAPKREPAMLYRRHVLTTASREEFVEGYFSAVYTTRENYDPYAPNPRGFDPAVRGTRDARSRELALIALATHAADDDPWYDVDAAYEHYAARSLFQVNDGYVEGVWFLSTGIDTDPKLVLEPVLEAAAQRENGEFIGLVGPYPANEGATPNTGLRLTRARRAYVGGLEEFESRIVDLSYWPVSQ
jgi:hypothetical protein